MRALRTRTAAAALLLALAACAEGERRPPVTVIAVDGLEWSVVEPLLREGRMPHLQSLLDAGVGGVLDSFKPTFSPVLWTTVATGRTPDGHGILFFSEVDPATGEPKPGGLPYTSECRRSPAIWNLADEAGKSVNAVAWWVSWPAERLRHGTVVASYAAQVQGALLWKAGAWKEGLPELVEPARLEQRIGGFLAQAGPDGPYALEEVASFGQWPLLEQRREAEERWGKDHVRDLNFRMSYISDRAHLDIACSLLEERVADLNLVYLGSTDVAGHYFWRYHEPGAYAYAAHVPPERQSHFGEHVRKSYEATDRWIGEILARLPEERVVMVVADHGMRAYNQKDAKVLQTGHHWEAEPGVFILSGSGVERRGLLPAGRRRLGTLLDVAPTLCDLLGIPALKKMQGRSLRAHMSEAWRAEQPEPARKSDPAFRKTQPPREPTPNASETFLEQLNALGYIELPEEADPGPATEGTEPAADPPAPSQAPE